MKQITFFSLFVLITLSVAMSASAQEKFSKVVTDADLWENIQFDAVDDCTGEPEECAVRMLNKLDISVGETPEFSVYNIGEENGKDTAVVFVSHFIDEDDDVLAELYRLEFHKNDAAFSLNEVGKMYQCMEGRAGWRKTPCVQ